MSTELDQVNQQYIHEYLPAFIVGVLIVIVGFIGNSVAAIYFGWKAPKSVVHFLVFALSINDAITNLVFVDNLVKVFFFINYRNVVACKIIFILRRWLVGNSLALMVPIAIDRFRKICHPFSKQLTFTSARWTVFGIAASSLLISARSYFSVDVLRINITSTSNSTKGFYCWFTEENDSKAVERIFSYVDICLHVCIICCVIVCYSLTARRILQSRKKLGLHDTKYAETNQQNNENIRPVDECTSDTVDMQLTETQIQEEITNVNTNPVFFISKESIEQDSNKTKGETLREKIVCVFKQKNNGKKKHKRTRAEIRVTLMVAVITMASIVCFLPYYLSVLIVKYNFSGNGLIMSVENMFLSRVYFLNSAINPLVMVALNKSFRDFIRSISRCK